MGWSVELRSVGKRFRRYHADAPQSFHEALLRGFRNLLPAEQFWVLRDVNLRVPRGRMVGLIGRNGAGKSTLLRLIGGIGRPDEGAIHIEGRLRALLTLGAGFHPELTGRENVMLSGIIAGLTRRELNKHFDSIVGFAEMEDFIDSPLRAYSSGMQMRLAFSVAIHTAPDILLIDEVLAVGDIAFQRKCMDQIDALKANGCTIILVSHDMQTVQELCDEAIWLRGGKVAAQGPSAQVVGRYLVDADHEAWSHMIEDRAVIEDRAKVPV